jgi:hypothetical protein
MLAERRNLRMMMLDDGTSSFIHNNICKYRIFFYLMWIAYAVYNIVYAVLERFNISILLLVSCGLGSMYVCPITAVVWSSEYLQRYAIVCFWVSFSLLFKITCVWISNWNHVRMVCEDSLFDLFSLKYQRDLSHPSTFSNYIYFKESN